MTPPRPPRVRAVLNRRQALGRVLGLGAATVAPGLLRSPTLGRAGGVGGVGGRSVQSPGATGPGGASTTADEAAPTPVGGAEALRPTIRPRSDWAGDRAVRGELLVEDDVRFLLVHHTASTNDYGPDEVAAQIQGFYEFHTGPEKGWPDVAYNFFVDRFGGIWEGRQGSLTGAVRGDATGGSQGFSQLCSLIGNYQEGPVTAEQQASLTQLLAWLGETYGVDTTPGATVTFTSRGSNKWPAGQTVTARTISGHRDMSLTSCPGDQAYALVAETLPARATTLRAEALAAATTSTTAPSTTAPVPATTAPATVPPATGATLGADTLPGTGSGNGQAAGPAADDSSDDTPKILLAGGAGLLALAAGLGRRLFRRTGGGSPGGRDGAGPPGRAGGADGSW